MPVIAFASHKGGCGKTTITTSLAQYLRSCGHTVSILDCDANGHASDIINFYNAARQDAPITVFPNTDERNLYARLSEAQGNDFILLDLPGIASQLTLMALTRAHLIIIPIQPSRMDARDGAKTAQLARAAEETIGRKIETRFLLSRWPVMQETLVAKHTKSALQSYSIGVLPTPFMDRTAFKELTYNGQSPSITDPEGNAALNIKSIANDILSVLSQVARAAAASAA
ncbi:ParA family protein [Nitrospirillum amazonense]|uniref:ParA family protein n=1 Tax=Nitrospirillum amazonense TaxID=28077 RepID=UPI002412D965|nr:ParA family protein [Nitrospirillum amazonense]MDG3443701.1 ParA family protein [Nitrospirillum amazonense]